MTLTGCIRIDPTNTDRIFATTLEQHITSSPINNDAIRDQFILIADEIVDVLMEFKFDSANSDFLDRGEVLDRLADKFDQLLTKQFYEITTKMNLSSND